jgi:cytoskeleton protein RodZ
MRTIGQQFQSARKERGLSIEDVTFHTRIPAARVKDMENDDLSRFANLTYARGFLKLYAAYLELDLSDYLGQFRTEDFAHASGHEYVQTANATNNLPTAVAVDQARSRRPGTYLLGLAMLTAGVIVWMNHTPDEKDGGQEPATVMPAPESPEPPVPGSPPGEQVSHAAAAVAEAELPLLPLVQPEPPAAINTSTATNPTTPPKAKIIEAP